jgi:glycerol kinase
MIDNWEDVRKAHETDDLAFGTVESWIAYVSLGPYSLSCARPQNDDGLGQNLLGGVSTGQHISEVTNASRTLLLNIRTLEWDPALLRFFALRESILPRLVSTSEVYGNLANGPLKGVPLAGLVGDQQGALIGNKCLAQGQAKCTYGTGAFLLFCTGTDIVYSNHGLLSTVRHCAVPAM